MTRHLETTPARFLACPRCHAPIITALAGGLTIHADPAPLTLTGEAAALITGRRTYDILTAQFRIYLERRTVTRIAAGRKHPVIASHPCSITLGPRAGTEIIARLPATPLPDKPPY